MYNIYKSLISARVLRVSNIDEINSIKSAYGFMINYEMVEQKYSVMCNNHIDLQTELVLLSNKTMNCMTPAMLRYANCEINRRIFNYLSSHYAYHEFMDELYKDKIDKISIVDFKKIFEAERSANEMLEFCWDLRHFYNHYGFPATGTKVYLNRQALPPANAPIITGIEMTCSRDELLKSRFRWSNESKIFLSKQDDHFELLQYVLRSHHIWIVIHEKIRNIYSGELVNCFRRIINLFNEFSMEIGKDTFCIADESKVTKVDGDNAIIEHEVHIHCEFIERIKYYKENFSPKHCDGGTYVSLAPKEYSRRS